MSLLLAIDGGSQSTKVSVVDAHGVVLAAGRQPLRAYELGPGGRAVHPDDDLWDSLVVACRAALADLAALGRSGAAPQDVVAVGLCGIRFCRALLDAQGRLVEPVLSWMDDRVSRALEPVGGGDEVATVTSAGGYLAARLTGERRDSAAAYAGMWPWDPLTRGWSTDPAEAARTRMPLDLLPELVEPGETLGRLTGGAARTLGLPVGLPVVATANDKAVEALGAGVVDPGPLLLSLGTYVAAMTVTALPVPAGDDRVWANAAAVPGTTLAESGGIRRGMWTVSWLRDLTVAGHDAPVDPDLVLARLEEGARELPPGSDGLLTVPDWLAPGAAPYRRGAILGLTGAHGAAHLYRSVLEGLALTMRGHVEAMEAALGRRTEEVVVSGGGARSPLLRQVVADVLGRPARSLAVPDAAGTGAAICAAVGGGVHASFAAAVAAMVHPGEVAEPDPERSARYDELAATYAALPEHTDPLFRRIGT